jgi:hypothetical protein
MMIKNPLIVKVSETWLPQIFICLLVPCQLTEEEDLVTLLLNHGLENQHSSVMIVLTSEWE